MTFAIKNDLRGSLGVEHQLVIKGRQTGSVSEVIGF